MVQEQAIEKILEVASVSGRSIETDLRLL